MNSRRRVNSTVGRLLFMNQKSVAFACALLILVAAANCAGQQPDKATGTLQLNVLTPTEMLIPYISAIIEGDQYQKQLPLNVEAVDPKVNSLELPVGVYRVSTRNGNYYDFQRSPFHIRANTVTKINVYPLLRVRMQMLMADGTDRYQFAPKPKYDTLAIPGSSLNVFVRYDKKREANGSVTYSSNVAEGPAESRGVMVTYDALAIYAPSIRFDTKELVLYANGNVVFEDGNERSRLKALVVKLKGGVPEVTRN
jgi:hypothetical protein